jgi:hypothetical protein
MTAIRPDPVSEVGLWGDILLAFAAMQEAETPLPIQRNAGRKKAPMEHDAHAKTSPVIPGGHRNDGEEEEEKMMSDARRDLVRPAQCERIKLQRREGRGYASLMQPAKP